MITPDFKIFRIIHGLENEISNIGSKQILLIYHHLKFKILPVCSLLQAWPQTAWTRISSRFKIARNGCFQIFIIFLIKWKFIWWGTGLSAIFFLHLVRQICHNFFKRFGCLRSLFFRPYFRFGCSSCDHLRVLSSIISCWMQTLMARNWAGHNFFELGFIDFFGRALWPEKKFLSLLQISWSLS